MITSLGICNARTSSGPCPGEVTVTEVVGGIASGVCGLCGTEYAAPVKVSREPEPEPDFLDETGRWWDR